MSYDPYDAPPRERTSKRYYREEREPRYADPRDNYLGVSHDLVPRHREDSDLSVEEIRRDFPPPGYSNRDIRRARSAGGPYYDDYDDRRSHNDRDYYDEPRSGRKTDTYYEEETKKKARVMSKQEQIIAAITGAAIAIGGKEIYDRREAKEHESEIQRNVLASAALGAAGALAGYSGTELYNKHKGKDDRKAHAHRGRGDYSDDESGSEKKGGKNFLEAALAAAGLGGAVKALTGGGDKDDKSDARSRAGGSRSSSGSRAKGKGEGAKKIQQAAMASLIAGATEAFRVSKEPGGWKGEKAKRILTAAAGAATIDAAQGGDKGGSKLGLAESVIGGLVGNRVIHGSKKNIEEDEKTGRSRSRSRARSKSGDGGGGGGGVSGLAALATAGLGAFGAKKIMDNRERSKSRGRDSDDGSPDRRRRSRSRSVVDKARKGLAKLGIGNGPADDDDDDDDRDRNRDRSRSRGDRDRRRRDYDDDDHEGSKSSHRHRDSHDDYDRDRKRYDDDYDDRSHHGRDRDRKSERGTVARRGSASSTELGDSDEDERRTKKMRGKQILTTGLASVATIHAAASVYQSMEKRKKRQKAVKEGRLSPEAAKKLKSKALLQDAASVGIAALGIKSAISEMKEVHELRQEAREWNEERETRKERRRDRLQRRLSQQFGGSSSSSSSSSDEGGRAGGSMHGNGRRRADSFYSAAPPRADRYDDGPHYTDGNPYGALPPPGGPSGRR